jgi:hypothetical protein
MRVSRLDAIVCVSVVITGAIAWTVRLSVTEPTSSVGVDADHLPGVQGHLGGFECLEPGRLDRYRVNARLEVERLVVALRAGLNRNRRILRKVGHSDTGSGDDRAAGVGDGPDDAAEGGLGRDRETTVAIRIERPETDLIGSPFRAGVCRADWPTRDQDRTGSCGKVKHDYVCISSKTRVQ